MMKMLKHNMIMQLITGYMENKIDLSILNEYSENYTFFFKNYSLFQILLQKNSPKTI